MSRARCKTGVAGLSIEDSTGDKDKPLYERALAVERIKAARKAIERQQRRAAGRPLRGVSVGLTDLKLVIDRLTAYAEAGADCLYAPGMKTREDIAAVVKAVHPKPFNLLIGASGLSLQEAADLGVRRISVGGSLARAAWGGFMRAAKEMAEKGTFARTRQRLSRRRTQQDVQLRRKAAGCKVPPLSVLSLSCPRRIQYAAASDLFALCWSPGQAGRAAVLLRASDGAPDRRRRLARGSARGHARSGVVARRHVAHAGRRGRIGRRACWAVCVAGVLLAWLPVLVLFRP